MTENFPQGMLRRVLVVRDPQEPREFRLEMAHGLQAGSRLVDVIESSRQQIMQFTIGMFRLHSGFQQLTAVSGEQGGDILAAQSLPPVMDRNLAQGVEISALRPYKIDLAAEKQIQFPGEGALGAEGSLGGGFDQSVIRGEPVDNQAGVRQSGQTRQNRRHRITLNLSGKEMKPKPKAVGLNEDRKFLLLLRLSRNKKSA